MTRGGFFIRIKHLAVKHCVCSGAGGREGFVHDTPVTAVHNPFGVAPRFRPAESRTMKPVKCGAAGGRRYHGQPMMPAPMTARPPDPTAAAPPALTAFLRGVERRGAVFAQLLAGSPEAGDAALASAMRGFRPVASRAPFVEWPRRFWALLLAAPTLRRPLPDAAWTPPFTVLAAIGHGPRAVLLLRLVAGLSESDAAATLGIARNTYRLALHRALPHLPDGTPDVAIWHALGDAAQAAVRGLPTERLAHLSRDREAAVHGRPSLLVGPGDALPPRVRGALWGVGLVTVLALAATWIWPGGYPGAGEGAAGIRIEPLGAAATPAARLPPEALLATDPDLDLLLDDALEPAALDPAFHAWLAAQTAGEVGGLDAVPVPLEAAELPLGDDAAPETIDVP